MASQYYEIHASGYYYDIDIDGPPQIDFLERRKSALSMLLTEIEDLMWERKNLFSHQKNDLEKRISEFQLRLKTLMPGDQLLYPGQAVFELEAHRLDLEKELRGREVEFFQDTLHLQDRLREIMLDHGNLLAIGDKDGMERQVGSSRIGKKTSSFAGEKDR